MNCNKDDGGIETTTNSSDGQHHHHNMSKLANGINKIVVKCNVQEAQNNNMPTLRRKNTIGSTGSLNSTGSGGMMMSSTSPSINFATSSNNNASVGASLSYAKAAASSIGGMNDTDDCDKSQSSISGASLERRSSFRSRAGKAYSPRWVDQKHNYQHDNLQQHHNTQGYDTDDKSSASFSQIKRKSGEMFHSHHHDSASQASFGGGGHDSHDEGYLSQHSSTGYDHSYHPALSYAASVKSDIATVCSTEDIDMEMGSVASDGGGKKPPPQHQQPKDDIPKPKGVEFASNILNPLNDMGPPQALCSALLLAANAACQPNSLGFEQQSDVEAHVDTDDCCDRSIDAESEVSTLHSQEDDNSHKDCNLDESERIRPDGGMKSESQHSLNLPLQRFQQGQVDLSHLTDNPNFPPLQHAEERADDWSNSRSHSRSPSRSPSPSSTKSKCSRSRSRSRSPNSNDMAICQQANRPSWYRESELRPPQAANADMEDADTEEPKYRVDFSSKIE